MLARMAIMAMTTSNSIKVKPGLDFPPPGGLGKVLFMAIKRQSWPGCDRGGGQPPLPKAFASKPDFDKWIIILVLHAQAANTSVSLAAISQAAADCGVVQELQFFPDHRPAW
jgi:hypothetical protein